MKTQILTGVSVERRGAAVVLLLVFFAISGIDVSARESRESPTRFDRIGLEEGLSQGSVYAVIQDREGFMWFGTEEGLNRYDGFEFEVKRHRKGDATTLSDSFVWSIIEDRRGNLWVGTESGGVSRWDPQSETFTRYRHDEGDPSSLASDRVRVVFEDRGGSIWVGTDGGGLARFDAGSGTFEHVRHDPDDLTGLGSDHVRSISEDQSAHLWIGTEGGGLTRLDPDTGEMRTYRHDPDDATSLSSDRVRSVLVDGRGDVWVGTYDAGLNRLAQGAPDTFDRYTNNANDPTSISPGRIRTIFEDGQGRIWIGTDGGADLWDQETGRFTHYRNRETDPRSLSDNRVTVIYQSREGVMWLGTKGGGVNKFNPLTGGFLHVRKEPGETNTVSSELITSFATGPGELWIGTIAGLNHLDRVTGVYTHYLHDPNDPGSLSDSRVMSLLLDAEGQLWVGTLDGGLNRWNRARGRFEHYRHDPADPTSLSGNGVTSLYQDTRGSLWVGTWGGGLNRFDDGTFARYSHDPEDPESLGSDRVTCFYEDRQGRFWIGTDGSGLNEMDRDTDRFTRFRSQDDDASSLSSDVIWSIEEDEQGDLWIGTQGGGLERWTREDRGAGRAVFAHYDEDAGLANNFVYGVHVDQIGHLWMSTNNGISRLDPKTGVFKNYDLRDGLQSNEFNFGSHHRAADGELFFGGNHGFNAFYPEKIRSNSRVPQVALTRFLKLNQRVDLPSPIDQIDQIDLSHRDDVITFEFASLDYTASDKNRYSYKLEGFNEDWIELGNVRRATYTNLDAGHYVFRVRGSNNDGVWNEVGAWINLNVAPPPWQSWWAYLGYGLLALAAVGFFPIFHKRKLGMEIRYREMLEREVKIRTAELASKNKELLRLNVRLEDAALTDELTGLRNRRYIFKYINKEIAAINRAYVRRQTTGSFAISPDQSFLLVDLDGLKEINDQHGHEAGDSALLTASRALESCCREADSIIRWGGDEFLVVARDAKRDQMPILAERIRVSIENACVELQSGQQIGLSCSIGFATYPFLSGDHIRVGWEEVVGVADFALYVAKHNGRNGWVGVQGLETIDSPLDQIRGDLNRLIEAGRVEFRSSFENLRLDRATAAGFQSELLAWAG